jgi:hypothetical protein
VHKCACHETVADGTLDRFRWGTGCIRVDSKGEGNLGGEGGEAAVVEVAVAEVCMLGEERHPAVGEHSVAARFCSSIDARQPAVAKFPAAEGRGDALGALASVGCGIGPGLALGTRRGLGLACSNS